MKSNFDIGSSETIREVSFNFDLFIKNSVLHKKKFKLSELEWLIGFTEGNGSFIVSKNRNFFIITQKSCKSLHKIKQRLGFGSVTKAGENFRYIVAKNADVFKLICLFNGNLLLNKTKVRFELWLANYNLLNKTNILYSRKCVTDSILLKNSGWLSGFIDSEGCFYALLRKDKVLSLRLSLFIDQKDEPNICERIAKEFNGYVTLRSSSTGKVEVEASKDNPQPKAEQTEHLANETTKLKSSYYRVVLSSKLSRQSIVSYLSKYVLLGDKNISFLRWQRLHNLVTNATISKMNLEKLIRLCKNINKREN